MREIRVTVADQVAFTAPGVAMWYTGAFGTYTVVAQHGVTSGVSRRTLLLDAYLPNVPHKQGRGKGVCTCICIHSSRGTLPVCL